MWAKHGGTFPILFDHSSIKNEINEIPPSASPGFSSGSAGGSLVGSPPPDLPAMPPHGDVPEALPETVPSGGKVEQVKDHATLETLEEKEKQMVERLQTKMAKLEEEFTAEINLRKQKAEQNLEQEFEAKRRKLDDEIFDLQEQRNFQESQLALAGEQLQERMYLVSEEQKVLDDLRDKTKTMQARLEAAATEPNKPQVEPKGSSTPSAKDLLKQKLEQTAKKRQAVAVAETPSPPSSQPTPRETVPSGDGVVPCAVVPVSDQRFTSSTHPQAWHCLYRMTRKPDGCDAEIYKKWHEGLVCMLLWVGFCWSSKISAIWAPQSFMPGAQT